MDPAEPLWDSLEHRKEDYLSDHTAQVIGTVRATPNGPKGHLEEI